VSYYYFFAIISQIAIATIELIGNILYFYTSFLVIGHWDLVELYNIPTHLIPAV